MFLGYGFTPPFSFAIKRGPWITRGHSFVSFNFGFRNRKAWVLLGWGWQWTRRKDDKMPKRIGWWATTMFALLGLAWVGLFAVELSVSHGWWRVVPMKKGK